MAKVKGSVDGGKGNAVITVLPTRHDMHLLRKVWHCLMGTVVALLHGFYLPSPLGVYMFSVLFLKCIILEISRKNFPTINKMIQAVLGPLMRSHEVDKVAGTFYYAMGCWFAATFLPKVVAVHTILCLGWVDPIASTTGILLQKTGRLGNGKCLYGMVVGGTAVAVVGYVYLGYTFPFIDQQTQLLVAVLGGLVAGLVEVR